MTADFDQGAFLAERRAMLLSLDLDQARAYLRKYGEHVPDSDDVLLLALHRARTAALDLPLGERIKSRWWLREHGSKPFP